VVDVEARKDSHRIMTWDNSSTSKSDTLAVEKLDNFVERRPGASITRVIPEKL
jgi:hypothetical protein